MFRWKLHPMPPLKRKTVCFYKKKSHRNPCRPASSSVASSGRVTQDVHSSRLALPCGRDVEGSEIGASAAGSLTVAAAANATSEGERLQRRLSRELPSTARSRRGPGTELAPPSHTPQRQAGSARRKRATSRTPHRQDLTMTPRSPMSWRHQSPASLLCAPPSVPQTPATATLYTKNRSRNQARRRLGGALQWRPVVCVVLIEHRSSWLSARCRSWTHELAASLPRLDPANGGAAAHARTLRTDPDGQAASSSFCWHVWLRSASAPPGHNTPGPPSP